MYGKKNVIEAMLEGETEETKEMMRSELANMDEAEFNDMAKQAGFDRVGKHWVGAKIGNAEQREESTSLLKEEPVKENKDFTPDNEIGGQENAKGGRTENSEVSSEVTPRVEQGEENISDVRNNAKEGTTEEVTPTKEQSSPSRSMYDKMEELHNSVQEAGRKDKRAKAEELRKFNEENGTLYNDFKEIFNQLRERGEDVFKTIGPCPK